LFPSLVVISAQVTLCRDPTRKQLNDGPENGFI